MSENQKNHESNAVIERALSIGLQRANKNAEEDVLTLKMSESQVSKAEEICDFMGCSLGNLLNLAVNCAISSAKIKGVRVNELEGYPKELLPRGDARGDGSRYVKVELSTKTYIKIEEAGMNERVTECAVLGIELFHKNFIENNRPKEKNE